MDSQHLQQIFFEQLQTHLPENISLVDEVSDALDISVDGAYRRIRGEKLLSFQEVNSLSLKYKISVDHIFNLKSDDFAFRGRIPNNSDFTYENWLQSIVHLLNDIVSYAPDHHLYCLPKGLPISYYFLVPELAVFNSFTLMKSIFHIEDWADKKFSVNDTFFEQYKDSWNKINLLYSRIPSTEVWHEENINTIINQIEYYRLAGVITSKEDAVMLLEKLEELLKHIEHQADFGKKFYAGNIPQSSSPNFNMYVNDLNVGDDTIFLQLGLNEITYIRHSIINLISTIDASFNNLIKRTIQNILQNSTFVSVDGEKKRQAFFDALKNKIALTKQKIC